jgi:hypothetical protein
LKALRRYFNPCGWQIRPVVRLVADHDLFFNFLLNSLYAGPDAQRNWREILGNDNRKVEHEGDEVNSTHKDRFVLDFFASELRLRGSAQVVQPHSKGGDILCWNGEVCVDKPFLFFYSYYMFEDI